ncbi:tropomyosin A-like [Palaemon carinicauda]|uniref:tropomyosin A-like n=1 Tax=Palaemon carinicauda TaxID=392227 RepID=UPI0035B67162
MFTNNALKAISEYGKKYLLGGPSSEHGFQDQQPRLMELEGLRLILGGGLLMRKFWAKEDKSEALEPVLDQEELDSVSEEMEAVISGKDPLLSDEEEQLLLSGGTGSAVSNRDVQVQLDTEHPISNRDVQVKVDTEHLTSNRDVQVQVDTEHLTSNRDVQVQVDTEHLTSNRDVQVQVETGPVSNTDVTVQTDGHTEIEDLRRKNENLAEELAIKQAVIEAHENQIDDYYQSILELKAELKMAQEKNFVQNQKESALVKEKEALKQELEDKVTLDEENTMKIVQLTEELEKTKKEIEAHDELKISKHPMRNEASFMKNWL